MIRSMAITIAAALALAACGSTEDRRPVPTSPASTNSTGYRYTDWLERWEEPSGECESVRSPNAGVTVEQRVETWVDRNMNGHQIYYPGTITKGDPGDLKYPGFYAPDEGSYEWGDAPRPNLAEMPTDPAALRARLIADYKAKSSAARQPAADEVHDQVIYTAVIVLGDADTSAQLRAALFGAIARTPGAQRVSRAEDPRGRPGTAVRIHLREHGGGVLTVIFDQARRQLLAWSMDEGRRCTPDHWHMVRRAAHVARVGDRG